MNLEKELIVSDLGKDPSSKEIQQITKDITVDQKYRTGASKFIGEAFKDYSERNK